MRLVLVRIMNMVRALMYMMRLEIHEVKYNQIKKMYFLLALARPERTKQMEQTLRAKVEIFFKSENLKKCF